MRITQLSLFHRPVPNASGDYRAARPPRFPTPKRSYSASILSFLSHVTGPYRKRWSQLVNVAYRNRCAAPLTRAFRNIEEDGAIMPPCRCAAARDLLATIYGSTAYEDQALRPLPITTPRWELSICLRMPTATPQGRRRAAQPPTRVALRSRASRRRPPPPRPLLAHPHPQPVQR